MIVLCKINQRAENIKEGNQITNKTMNKDAYHH
jgi:hypothetical protein